MRTQLYSLALPLWLLPVMDFSFSQIPKYLVGPEFRAFFTEILVQLTSGVVDAVIYAAVYNAFGITP